MISQNRILAMVLALALILNLSVIIIFPRLTGKATEDKFEKTILNLEKSFEEDSTLELKIIQARGVMLTGEYTGTGKARVYLKTRETNLLIAEIEGSKQKPNQITGFEIYDVEKENATQEQNQTVIKNKTIESNLTEEINTTQIAEEIKITAELNQTINKSINITDSNITPNITEEEVLNISIGNETINISVKTNKRNTTQINLTVNITTENNTTVNTTASETNFTNQTVEQEPKTPKESEGIKEPEPIGPIFNITNETVKINKSVELKNITLANKTKEKTIKFKDKCIETCLLPETSDITSIIIEVEKGILTIESLTYLHERENQYPVQIKDIPNPVFYGNYSINGSEYFIDPENESLTFDSKNIDGIDVEINNDIVTYRSTNIGNYEAYIYAIDSKYLLRSNTFWINITNQTFENLSINQTLNFTLNQTLNITVNQTFNLSANITKFNETIQFPAEIGKPVKWLKKIRFDENKTNISVKLPKKAKNITFYKKEKQEKKNISKIKTKNHTNRTELLIEDMVQEIEIEYYTEAPQVLEEQISKYRKQITVYSDEHYENILTYTELPELTDKHTAITLYWLRNNTKTKVQNVTYLDLNNNNLIDRIQWITPHLSNETYEIDITIINVQSYPTVGGNWSVIFNTTGQANLTIRAVNGTTWSNTNEDEELSIVSCQ